uniref:Uncharacterized protein n=1 Tax=Candidatus Kentrum sp. TUN TaxID=2126343 RepID=A0A451A258_9GAMM|nr:MAG: hypothetical protein BECKTUN1418F_GA0071002_11995 [Candidatus Kentron sp. TUN]VFK69494.1 MAG: hypothetical protein BECKTUN1418E_GA0071001_11966 [Candidatus Kentron sp. TUN]
MRIPQRRRPRQSWDTLVRGLGTLNLTLKHGNPVLAAEEKFRVITDKDVEITSGSAAKIPRQTGERKDNSGGKRTQIQYHIGAVFQIRQYPVKSGG